MEEILAKVGGVEYLGLDLLGSFGEFCGERGQALLPDVPILIGEAVDGSLQVLEQRYGIFSLHSNNITSLIFL